MLQNGHEHMDVVIYTQRVRYGQEYGIRFLYRFVLRQLFDQLVWFGGITLAENRPFVRLNIAEAIRGLALLPKVIPVLVGYQGKNRTAHRNPCLALMAAFFQASL